MADDRKPGFVNILEGDRQKSAAKSRAKQEAFLEKQRAQLAAQRAAEPEWADEYRRATGEEPFPQKTGLQRFEEGAGEVTRVFWTILLNGIAWAIFKG